MTDEVEQGSPQSTPEPNTPSPKPRRRLVPRRKRWTTIERDLRRDKGPLLAGVDEVGRGPIAGPVVACAVRSEEHTSELQSRSDLVCRLLLEKKKDSVKHGHARQSRLCGNSV